MPFIPPHLITVVQGMIKKTKPSLYMQLFLQFLFFFQEVDYPKMRFFFDIFRIIDEIFYYVKLIKIWFHFQCNRSLNFCEWNFFFASVFDTKILNFIWISMQFCNCCPFFFKNYLPFCWTVAMVKITFFFAKVVKHAHLTSWNKITSKILMIGQ